MSNLAVCLKSVSKKFAYSHSRSQTLQESFLRHFGARRSQEFQQGSFWALQNIDLEIEHGRMLGLVGDNGSGKSTILKLISRILSPTTGEIEVNGRVAALLELGAGFHPDLTGRENIHLNGSILGLGGGEIRRRLDDIVAFADIGPFIDTPLRHYSSGMQVRLGFAIATTLEPEILLIDEVLAVGDQNFQRKCIARIRELHVGGVTVIFVSHNLDTVRKICDSAVWIDEGRTQATGDPDEVIGRYLQHVARETQSGSKLPMLNGRNWGSGEAVITGVEFLDADGRTPELFVTGQSLTARIHYLAHQRVEQPAFGVAIYGPDGTHLTGPNTALNRLDIPAIEGEGHVDYIVDSLPLMHGRYEFTAAIYDYDSIHPFHHQHRAYSFSVARGNQPPVEGQVWIPCRWHHVPLSPSSPNPNG
jgi:ABC-type polysaccharide/polyol phosphate transport system ATPase subunit